MEGVIVSSIIILGKGKSLLRCTKQYVDSFDKVSFVNLLRVSGFEKHISDRCDYLFVATNGQLGYMARDKNVSWQNSKHFVDSKYYIENKLGIKQVFNMSVHADDTISKFLDDSIEYDLTFRRRMMAQRWEQLDSPERNWFPPAGILAFEHFILSKKFKKISLVGFDFYEVAHGLNDTDIYNHYYFLDKDNKDVSKIGDGEDPDIGNYNNSEVNPHSPKKQIDYVITQVKQNPDIEFEIYTNCLKIKEQNLKNLKVL